MGSTELRAAAQQALDYMKAVGQMDMYPEEWAIVGRLEAALAEPQEPDSPERRCGGPGCDGACCQPVQEPVQQALCEADRIMGHDDEATEWRERWGHLFKAPPQRPAEPVQEPVGFKDAPERIWLQACEDDHCEVPFCEHNEITWCAEQQNPLDVQYVRADLAAPPKLPAEPQGCDHCEHPLSAGTRETLRLVDELALCAELKREYQEQFAQAAVQRDALLEALKELTGHTNKRFTGGVWDRARAAIKAVEEGK